MNQTSPKAAYSGRERKNRKRYLMPTGTEPALPIDDSKLQPRADLNDARIVRLRAQVDQACRRIRIIEIRMVEGIEEVAAHAQAHAFGDIEVLEHAEILVPVVRPKHEVPGIRAQVAGLNIGRDHRAVRQHLIYKTGEVRARRMNSPLRAI